MTQIEQIIAEIERLKKVFVPTVNVEYQDFSKFLLDFVIDSINSLPAEQESEDLDIDEELTRYFELNNLYVDSNDLQTVRHCNGSTTDKKYYFEDVARHFANLQKEQTINKACEWLLENVLAELVLPIEDKELIKDFIKNFKKAMKDEQ